MGWVEAQGEVHGESSVVGEELDRADRSIAVVSDVGPRGIGAGVEDVGYAESVQDFRGGGFHRWRGFAGAEVADQQAVAAACDP